MELRRRPGLWTSACLLLAIVLVVPVTLHASDLATHPALAKPTATRVKTGSNYSFAATSDTFVDQAQAAHSFGDWNQLNALGSKGTIRTVYLRFTVSGLPRGAIVDNVMLRLTVINTSTAGGTLHRVTNVDWPESINWNSRPRLGKKLGSLDAGRLGQVVELDVSGQVVGNGAYSFALVMPRGNGNTVGYASNEHSDPAKHPKLIVTLR
jgi:hypothetical protein